MAVSCEYYRVSGVNLIVPCGLVKHMNRLSKVLSLLKLGILLTAIGVCACWNEQSIAQTTKPNQARVIALSENTQDIIDFTITKLSLMVSTIQIKRSSGTTKATSIELSQPRQAQFSQYDKKIKFNIKVEGVDVFFGENTALITIPTGAKLYGTLEGLLNADIRFMTGQVGIKKGETFVSEGAEATVNGNQFIYVQGQWIPVKSGTNVHLICEAQELLSNLGFSPGPVDGLVGDSTQQALAAFLNIIQPQDAVLSDQIILEYLRDYQAQNNSGAILDTSPASTRPTNGKIFQLSQKNEVAPLEVRTPSKGYDFFVKLVDANTRESVKSFYIRGGMKTATEVPLGSYNLKYATGKQWHSQNCLFGTNTMFSKADKVFEFKREGDKVSGYSVELILQLGGNLSTSTIQPDEW